MKSNLSGCNRSLYSPESFRQRFAMETVETALRSQTRRGKVRC